MASYYNKGEERRFGYSKGKGNALLCQAHYNIKRLSGSLYENFSWKGGAGKNADNNFVSIATTSVSAFILPLLLSLLLVNKTLIEYII